MKPWVAVVIVLVVLAGGLALMAPRDEPATPGGPMDSAASDEKIAVISKGSRVDIPPHLKSGRFTIVEFTADW
jgi:hypothetical protein